jgi:hypothetical protein
MAGLMPAGGGVPQPAAPAIPAHPHVYARIILPGADNTLDYVAVPTACKIIKSLPSLDWKVASAVMPAHHAAPALQLAWVVCAPAHADFDAAAAAPMLALSELTVRFTLQTLNIFADAIDSLKVFDRIYKRSDDYFDALERALPAAPSPSPFLVATANLEEPGFRPPGRAGGSCRCCCCGVKLRCWATAKA